MILFLFILSFIVLNQVLSSASDGRPTLIGLSTSKFIKFQNDHDKDKDGDVTMFSSRLLLELPEGHQVSQVHGRFLTDPRNCIFNFEYDTLFLQECADLNYSLVAEGNRSKKIQKFVKSMKSFLVEAAKEPLKINNTLYHFHCKHAIASCQPSDFGSVYFEKLLKGYPFVFKELLGMLETVEDFSFLTVELADILFVDTNYLLRPFALNNLVETVSVEVLVHLLTMWNYDLKIGDAQSVLNVWGTNSDFLNLVEKDPRSWLLWKKAGLVKPFPFDLLIESLNFSCIESYTDLILAWILDSETKVTNALGHLEFLYADFHKNDFVEETYMTPEMIKALDSRKWDLWREAGKFDFEVFAEQMSLKKRLINKIKTIKSENGTTGYVSEHLDIYELLTLLQIPMNNFARMTFNRSRNIDEVIAAMEKVSFYFPFYVPMVRTETLFNADFWTFLWKQIEVLEFEIVYDVAKSLEYAEFDEILQNIISTVRRFRTQPENSYNFYWLSQLALYVLPPLGNDLEKSNTFMKRLIEIVGDFPCEFTPVQMNLLRFGLHPETCSTYMKQFEAYEYKVEAYNMAPDFLTRKEISELIHDENLRPLIKSNYFNGMTLQTLADFTVEDLLEFFPIGTFYHLERHEALYTISPEVLTGYIKACEGAINYPEKLIWWVHPRCWNDPKFVDSVAEMIPFDALLRHPRDAETLNLIYILSDITGRLGRMDPSESAQKLIIKWLIQAEWICFQFFNIFISDHERLDAPVYRKYEELYASLTRARGQLVTWLQSKNNLEDRDELIQLITRIPLSELRASFEFEDFFTEIVGKINGVEKKKGEKKQKDKTGYTFFKEKKPHQYKLQDVADAVNVEVGKCTVLIEKYFTGRIEKQIWGYRLKIANIPTVSKYTTHPIRLDFSDNLFHGHKLPIFDLQVAFIMFVRQGFAYSIATECKEEYLVAMSGYISVSGERVKNYEKYIDDLRSIIINHELAKLRSITKK